MEKRHRDLCIEEIVEKSDEVDISVACAEIQRFLTFELSTSSQSPSRNRFYDLYWRLVDCIFGRLEDEAGGWMLEGTGYEKKSIGGPRAYGMGSVMGVRDGPPRPRVRLSRAGAALVDLLAPHSDKSDGFSTLFQVTRDQHPVHFKFDCSLLSSRAQLLLDKEEAQYSVVQSPVTTRLFKELLSIPLMNQVFDVRQPMLMLSMEEYFLLMFVMYPQALAKKTQPNGTVAAQSKTYWPSSGALSPLSASSLSRHRTTILDEFLRDGVGSLLPFRPYNHLLVQYLSFFFPYNNGGQLATREAELFLHLIIETWLGVNTVYILEGAASPSPSPSTTFAPLPTTFNPQSYQMQTWGDYAMPSPSCLGCLLVTLSYLVADPAVQALSEAKEAPALPSTLQLFQQPVIDLVHLVFGHRGYQHELILPLAVEVWLVLLEPWKAAIKYKGRSRTHPHHYSGPSLPISRHKGNTELAYSDHWKGYVLANYHVYTTLLASFVHRAADLSFSTDRKDRKATQNLVMMERVLSVYSSPLLGVLQTAHTAMKNLALLKPATSNLEQIVQQHQERVGLTIPAVACDLSAPSVQQCAQRLCEELELQISGHPKGNHPSQSPPLQRHLRTVASYLFPEEKSPGTPYMKRILPLLHHIFSLPQHFEPQVKKRGAGGSLFQQKTRANSKEARNSDCPLLLTDEGRYQIAAGLKGCDIADATFIGDPMNAPICSFEIGFLVHLLIKVSNLMNAKFCLGNFKKRNNVSNEDIKQPMRSEVCFRKRVLETQKIGFRFNLRFMADVRNILLVVIVMLFLKVLRVVF